ncbi:unnamed protein product, partial [Rotaria sordida]
MDADEEHRLYGDFTVLEPILEQQDDTRHFCRNESQSKDEENNRFSRHVSSKIPSEHQIVSKMNILLRLII